jgi:hypothetical protein
VYHDAPTKPLPLKSSYFSIPLYSSPRFLLAFPRMISQAVIPMVPHLKRFRHLVGTPSIRTHEEHYGSQSNHQVNPTYWSQTQPVPKIGNGPSTWDLTFHLLAI